MIRTFSSSETSVTNANKPRRSSRIRQLNLSSGLDRMICM